MIHLKPCPFCGETVNIEMHPAIKEGKIALVECSTCGAEVGSRYLNNEVTLWADEIWNREFTAGEIAVGLSDQDRSDLQTIHKIRTGELKKCSCEDYVIINGEFYREHLPMFDLLWNAGYVEGLPREVKRNNMAKEAGAWNE